MTIVLTKVRAPQRRKDVLRRVRLVDTLHQNLHRKLTFVSAPAGYGKTTLLVDFAADVDAHVCWYRIGPEDGDLVQFAQHIVAAFQQEFPGFGEALEERLNTPGARPDAPSIATELINAVQEQVPDFSVLVLDDYHLAGENQQIVDFLENLLEHLPDHLRILIGSRSVYGIPAASLYIRDELVTIGADELRFRADELQKLVLQNYRMRLSQEEAEELAKRADGWIVALLLAVRAMSTGSMPHFLGNTEQIYTYLAEEVVSQQSEELRQFMLGASIFSDFSEALCNYVMQREDSGDMLRSLEERNLFVSRTETREGNSYRFHQLFSEFLQDYFARHDPAQLRSLHSRAADWHFQRQEWENAVQHKFASGEVQAAAAWMDAAAEHFYTTGRQALLARWLEDLDKTPGLRQHAPRLILYQAKSLTNQSQFEACLKLLAEAEPILKQRGDAELLANAFITRGMVYRFSGKPQGAIDMAEAAQKLLTAESQHTLQWFQAERLRGVPLHVLGKTEAGIQHISAAVAGMRELAAKGSESSRTVYLFDLAECLNDLGLIHITSGQMLSAQQAFQEALDIHISIRSNLGALASARNNIAYLLHQTGQYQASWKQYMQALGNVRSSGRARVHIGILSGQGALLLDVGDPHEAQASLLAAVEVGETTGELQELVPVYVSLARVSSAMGDYNESMAWLRKAASQAGSRFSRAEYALHMGWTYANMEQYDLALQQLELALQNWSSPPQQDQVTAAFLRACVLYKLGKESDGEAQLSQALQGAAQLGYQQFLIPLARDWQAALVRAQAKVPSPQLADILEQASRATFTRSMLEGEVERTTAEPQLLEVHTLGSSEIRRNGEVLPVTLWRSTRARSLFIYILDRGRVRKDAIGIHFWPDFSPGKVSSNFHATLWRVRQALGFKDSIVFEDDHYSLHPSIQTWYDAREFENYMRMATTTSLPEAEQAELLRQAVRLYRGPYLEDVFMEWADDRREELRGLYLGALELLGNIEVKAGRHREAREIYERIVASDPYRDEAHLALMKSMADSGASSAAILHYKEYQKLLRRELNAEPIEALQTYYQQLTIRV
ncbi:MAG: tetratricopeptide repeat protein [Anaerolineales bacterium]|nr:MAG: tetratricopeptide repeat protein [Anaerolineales bacterium]